MADPTPAELQTQIDDLRSLIMTEYQPPSGPEVSFPVVNQPMNDDEWGALFKSFGSGIISFGQYPYRLILDADSDVTNQVRITPATDVAEKDSVGVVEGFAHRLMEDKKLTIDSVTSRTRYLIALQYNPVRVSEGGMPVVLDAFKGTLDQSQGKKYVLIYEGYRDPSTVLSQVQWTPVRSRLAPSITVQRKEHLPNPQHSGLIWGTRCYCSATDEEYLLSHDPNSENMTWERIAGTQIYTRPDTATYEWAGHGHRPRVVRDGNSVKLEGHVRKGDGNPFYAGGNSSQGYHVITVPEWGRTTASSLRFTTNAGATNGHIDQTVVVYNTGEVRLFTSRDTTFGNLDGCNWSLA